MKKALLFITNPRSFIKKVLRRVLLFLPDDLYLKCIYKFQTGMSLNLENPTLFTEKLQWLKLNNKNPLYTKLVDKYEVKKKVGEIIGESHIVKTLGVWDRFDDIDFESLPNRFVLKVTHDSGGLVICKNKKELNIIEARKKIIKSQKTNYYLTSKEWPYKDVPRRIIAEEFMEEYDESGRNKDLSDYKFFCFNGEPKYCQVIRDRKTNETIDFYDMNWNHQEFVGLNSKVRNGLTPVNRPSCLDEMIDICRKLSPVSPFTRVDLYVIKGCIYFGEITFFPQSGFGKFTPDVWNQKLGEMLDLSHFRNV